MRFTTLVVLACVATFSISHVPAQGGAPGWQRCNDLRTWGDHENRNMEEAVQDAGFPNDGVWEGRSDLVCAISFYRSDHDYLDIYRITPDSVPLDQRYYDRYSCKKRIGAKEWRCVYEWRANGLEAYRAYANEIYNRGDAALRKALSR